MCYVACMRVAILMATYNGERFLSPQLESFAAQTHEDWELWVSDDGSTDGTRAIIAEFSEKYPGRLQGVLEGPRKGFAQNFLSLTRKAGSDATYFAFCDQDDIWHPDHLARAVRLLAEREDALPLLYGGPTRYIDLENNEVGASKVFCHRPSFGNALVQCIAGGNTMVFNRATLALLKRVGAVDVPSHDWFAYQLVMAAGGQVAYDATPTVSYRQHPANLSGGNRGFAAAKHRLKQLLRGDLRRWNSANLAALAVLKPHYAPLIRVQMELFAAARHRPLLSRLRDFAKAGIYRQTLGGNLGLAAAAVLNKL